MASHQRTLSQAPKYTERTLEQRAIDAARNEPKYARERRVKAMLTAKYLKAKTIFEQYYAYDIDAAFDPDLASSLDANTTSSQFTYENDGAGGRRKPVTDCWVEERDPWLRIRDTLPEFLEAYTEILQVATSAGEGGAEGEAEGDEHQQAAVTQEGLQNLAVALMRVARAHLDGAGRDGKKILDEEFEKGIMELVERLKKEYNLPEHVEEEEEEGADDEEMEDGQKS